MSQYLILSVKHSTKDNGNCLLWWGPDRRGYVEGLDEAGRYSRTECVDIVGGGLVPRGGYLARSSVGIPESHEVFEGLVLPRIKDASHNLAALGALEIWEAYHG